MAVSPSTVNAQAHTSQMKAWETQIDTQLARGVTSNILVQLMFKESDAEALAKLYRDQGWQVSYTAVGGRSGGFTFSFRS